MSPAGGGKSAPLRGAPRELGPDPHRAWATWGPLQTTRGTRGQIRTGPGPRGVLCIPHGGPGFLEHRRDSIAPPHLESDMIISAFQGTSWSDTGTDWREA